MSNVIFLDLTEKDTFNTNKKVKKENKPLDSVSEIFNNDNKNILIKNNSIQQLHSHLLNSLNFQLETNSFPSTLPNEINIKFTQKNHLERLKKIAKDFWYGYNSQDIAKANIETNTIYMSTEFLLPPKDPFLKEFSEKFEGQQSLLDAIFYHEFSHIISINHFPQIKNIYSDLENALTNNVSIQKNPLSQVVRNLEETFSDAYAALLHKEKHYAFDTYRYISSRNSTTYGKSKGFDFNINSISQSFKKIDDINLTSDSIDNICNKLYKISIESTLEILHKTISENPEFEKQLIQNLHLLGNSNTNNIIQSVESLLISQQPTNFNIPNQSSVLNRIMSIRNYSFNQSTNSNKPII